MLVAVPVAAAIGVLVRFAIEQYKDGLLYRGLTGRADRGVTAGRRLMARQLVLRPAVPGGDGARRFLRVRRQCRRAWRGIDGWRGWPRGKMLLIGPEGAGQDASGPCLGRADGRADHRGRRSA